MYNSFENGTKEYNQKDQTLWFDDFNGLEVLIYMTIGGR